MIFQVIPASMFSAMNALAERSRANAIASATPDELEAAKIAAALAVAEQGDKVLDRIWFWIGAASVPIGGFIAAHFLDKLADRLDSLSDEIERWAQPA